MPTVADYLFQGMIPKEYFKPGTPVNKKTLNKALVDFAAADPEQYVKNVVQLKRFGDAASMYEGISAGLDDIEPEYGKRDALLNREFKQIKKLKDPAERIKAISALQTKMLSVAEGHKGDMGLMVRSGGRGNVAQLMRTVVSPIAVADENNTTVPWAIKRSFSEGLRPDEYFATTSEARNLAVMSNNAVTEPGVLGKLLARTMGDETIVANDCGTTNGLYMDVRSPKAADRYLAKDAGPYKRNTLLSSAVLAGLRKNRINNVTVRSPMTCEAPRGTCQYCYGQDAHGRLPQPGVNVGMRGAHALSEPLTQAMLSSKHGVRTVETEDLAGLDGMKLLLNVPNTFPGAATLASSTGEVTRVENAPQGGKFVFVGDNKHYVPPARKILRRIGDTVEAGDALSSGIPKPDEVVAQKGIGRGRLYYADKVYDTFSRTISDIDPRHVELLAKKHINYGKIDDDPTGQFIRGDIVAYTDLKKAYANDRKDVPLSAVNPGDLLADNYHEFLSGTPVTTQALETLRNRGFTDLSIAGPRAPRATFIMKPLTHAPLQDPDWVARLAHRNLKTSLLRAAGYGEESKLKSSNPIAPYLYGKDFGLDPEGDY